MPTIVKLKMAQKLKKLPVTLSLVLTWKAKKISFACTPSSAKKTEPTANKVFEDLVSRGLKKVLIALSDDFPGIIETVKAVYPYADHQLCFVHLQRNIRKYMTNVSILVLRFPFLASCMLLHLCDVS